ncbi:hypothetical protein ACGFYY_20990 [Streptomyces sp. NPDC048331]|uniref:hypothetical protein n=1 Tax=Streptomyces sp. NPDC048331 TaxID=3365534 RepID=UPI0037214F4B
MVGSLPDVRIPDCSVDDWQAVLYLVKARNRKYEYSVGDKALPMPRAETVLSRPVDAECAYMRVWLMADVLAIFRFLDAEIIDFDVDLRELQGQERLDVLCGFLRALGRCVGKPVLMDPEGEYGRPVLGFDVEADRVVLLAEPPAM